MRLLTVKTFVSAVVAALIALPAWADGDVVAWLRIHRNDRMVKVKSNDDSETARTAQREIASFWHGKPVRLRLDKSLTDNDGFIIRPSRHGRELTIMARRSAGLLYGAYELLRIQAVNVPMTGGKIPPYDPRMASAPDVKLRFVNYIAGVADNEDGHPGGLSLWKWGEIDGVHGTMSLEQREQITQFCRANASVGVNATVINVAADAALMLTTEYIKKIKVVAALLGKYGMRVFISVDTDAMKSSGILQTTFGDKAKERAWWKNKVRELYRDIRDFGGFIVKTEEERQLLADAMSLHKGLTVRLPLVNDGVADGVARAFDLNNSAELATEQTVQFHWYAFGRLAWNKSLSADRVQKEWNMLIHASQKAP